MVEGGGGGGGQTIRSYWSRVSSTASSGTRGLVTPRVVQTRDDHNPRQAACKDDGQEWEVNRLGYHDRGRPGRIRGDADRRGGTKGDGCVGVTIGGTEECER